MVLNNNKFKQKDRGFTIVELLVVIVVIGILAAITMVSYTNVTAKANTAKAQTIANAAVKVAEAYNADSGAYPITAAAFADGYGSNPTAKMPTGTTVVPQSTSLTSTTGKTTVTWACSPACDGTITGGRVTYFDFSTSTASTTIYYVGAAGSGSTFANPGS